MMIVMKNIRRMIIEINIITVIILFVFDYLINCFNNLNIYYYCNEKYKKLSENNCDYCNERKWFKDYYLCNAIICRNCIFEYGYFSLCF